MEDAFWLYTDGAARGNPGPAAIGAVLFRGSPTSGHVVAELSRTIGHATNNVAEYRAVIEGLEMAAGHSPALLVVRCDSLGSVAGDGAGSTAPSRPGAAVGRRF
ncbi:MAG: reverse transcriptase-like protein [Actinomycetia bacterium]|nr:reverse transcriptase-like protein [Actinomycetes bacterium]